MTFCHVIPVLGSHDINVIIIPSLHLLVQDDQNEMQHDFFSQLTLASVACDANGIANSTIVFIRSRQLTQCATELLWSFDAT